MRQPASTSFTTSRKSQLVVDHHFINLYASDMDPGLPHCLPPNVRVKEEQALVFATASQMPTHPSIMSTSPSPSCLSVAEIGTIARPVSCFPSFEGSELELLDYYLHRICPLTYTSHHYISPFAELIMPLLSSGGHDMASLAAMAFSARHGSLSRPEWSPKALTLRGKTLAAVRESLGVPEDMMGYALRNSRIPLAMMFLCMYEIFDSCDHRWVIHLRACQDFLHRRRLLLTTATPETDEERNHVSLVGRFFAFQDAISRTACGNPSVFSWEYWQQADLDGTDHLFGRSTKSAAILFKTTELGRMKDSISLEDFETRLFILDHEIASLDAVDAEDCLAKQSTKLYQHCLLRNATPSTPIVQELVNKLLKQLYTLVQETRCISSSLAFPLFISAVELDPLNCQAFLIDKNTEEPKSGRSIVLDILKTMSGSCLFNVGRLGDVIRQVWVNRDLHLETGATSAAGSAVGLNDWTVSVSPYCTNLSLA